MTLNCSLARALRAAHSRIEHANPSSAICAFYLVGKKKKAKMIRECLA